VAFRNRCRKRAEPRRVPRQRADGGALCRQRQCNGTAEAARCTSDYCFSSGKLQIHFSIFRPVPCVVGLSRTHDEDVGAPFVLFATSTLRHPRADSDRE
jgi:hypothetical protein